MESMKDMQIEQAAPNFLLLLLLLKKNWVYKFLIVWILQSSLDPGGMNEDNAVAIWLWFTSVGHCVNTLRNFTMDKILLAFLW